MILNGRPSGRPLLFLSETENFAKYMQPEPPFAHYMGKGGLGGPLRMAVLTDFYAKIKIFNFIIKIFNKYY